MIIEGIMIYADEGKVLRRIEDNHIMGKSVSLGYLYYMFGQKLPEPKLLTPEDFDEIPLSEIDELRHQKYVELAEQYIRERYTVSAELAIQRQRNEKKDEFEEYYTFCESCKRRAKEESESVYPIWVHDE